MKNMKNNVYLSFKKKAYFKMIISSYSLDSVTGFLEESTFSMIPKTNKSTRVNPRYLSVLNTHVKSTKCGSRDKA